MGSAHDVVESIETYDLDAMFLLTVIIGLTAFVTAWAMVVLAIKGWAVRQEQQKSMLDACGSAQTP